MIQAINVPEIGENVESGVVVAVHIKAGDTLAVDDTVIELETDKALVEIPSPFAGRVTEVLAEPGAQMNVGDVIARVETEGLATEAEEDAPAEEDAGLPNVLNVASTANAAQKKHPIHRRHQQPHPPNRSRPHTKRHRIVLPHRRRHPSADWPENLGWIFTTSAEPALVTGLLRRMSKPTCGTDNRAIQ